MADLRAGMSANVDIDTRRQRSLAGLLGLGAVAGSPRSARPMSAATETMRNAPGMAAATPAVTPLLLRPARRCGGCCSPSA